MKNRFVGAALAAVGIMFVAGAAAYGATGDGSFSATCDPASYGFSTDGKTYQHSAKGTVSIKQKSTNPVLTSSVKATSQNGNSLPVVNVSDGQTATWANVLPGQYKVYARSSSSVNCNGWLPGNGNYTFNYSITY